jgi:hypothetical protein
LIEYVRLTSAHKVTHIAWARTAQTATLFIPARSTKATIVNLAGESWWVVPESGMYRLVVGGAKCDDPGTVGGCLIGGAPWILVEEDITGDPLNEKAPSVTTESGGTLATPDPGPFLTATALAMPSVTPSPTELPTDVALSTQSPTQEQAAGVLPEETLPAGTPVEAAVPTPAPAPATGNELGPKGFDAFLPYLLMGLGGIVIAGGISYFFAGSRKATDPVDGETSPVDYQENVSEPLPKRRSRRRKEAHADATREHVVKPDDETREHINPF